MRLVTYFILLILAVLFVEFIFADEAVQFLLSEPSKLEWQKLVDLTERNDSTSLGMMALIVCQVIFLVFRTMLGEILGFYRLLVLAILSLLVTIGTNLAMGKTWLEALVFDASTLFAYQVAFHQIKRQWEKRSEDHLSLVRDSLTNKPRVRRKRRFKIG